MKINSQMILVLVAPLMLHTIYKSQEPSLRAAPSQHNSLPAVCPGGSSRIQRL